VVPLTFQSGSRQGTVVLHSLAIVFVVVTALLLNHAGLGFQCKELVCVLVVLGGPKKDTATARFCHAWLHAHQHGVCVGLGLKRIMTQFFTLDKIMLTRFVILGPSFAHILSSKTTKSHTILESVPRAFRLVVKLGLCN